MLCPYSQPNPGSMASNPIGEIDVLRHSWESAPPYWRRGRGCCCRWVRSRVSESAVECDKTGRSLAHRRQFAPLVGATEWLNSAPLTGADLRGLRKVVLVKFWTYTCINWLRQLPYVRGWAEKYKDQGLIVIGVHTPEFSFEHNVDNVRQAARDMRMGYPIAIDNDYAIRDAFTNRYWPALYFVDANGNIRHHHFGEGAYEESEGVL